MTGYLARAETDIAAKPAEVWDALVDPAAIAIYMFGADVDTDWRPGSSITWSGEFDGKPYEDKGQIINVVENERLTMTHYSPLMGKPDSAENYHTVDYQLEEIADGTRVMLEQDNNESEEEAERFGQNWSAMLEKLREVVESRVDTPQRP